MIMLLRTTVVRAGVDADLAHGAQEGHREPAARVHVTAEHVGQAVAPLLARQPGEDECVGVRDDVVERVGPAADHDDHHGHAVRRRLGDEVELLGREPEVRDVAELAGGVRLR